jgi:hypothetical protein
VNGRALRVLLGIAVLAGSLCRRATAVAAEPQAPNGAEAASAEQLAARADFREGSRLAQNDDWAGALARYSASQARFPHATTLYNLGYCREKLGDFAGAVRDTQGALLFEERFPGRGLSDELRARAKAAVHDLAAKVARAEVVAKTEDLALRVGGRALEVLVVEGHPLGFLASTAPEPSFSPVRGSLTLTLNPGSHLLEWQTAQAAGTRELALSAGDSVRLSLPEPPRVAPAVPPDKAPARPSGQSQVPLGATHAGRSEGARPLRTFGIAALGAGGGAALVGLGAGLLAAGTKRDLDESCTSEGACPPDQADVIDQFHTQAGVATVTLASAAVLAGLGVTLLLLDSPSPQRAALKLRVASDLTLAGHF